MKAAKQATVDKPFALDFFAAGLPAGMVFKMHLQDVLTLAETTESITFLSYASSVRLHTSKHFARIMRRRLLTLLPG